MKESELALKFIEYFSEGYEIFKEVPAGGIIDIYAKCENIGTAIEVKVSLNFEVIGQAFQNIHCAHFSYIAIPISKHGVSWIQKRICREFGIGILVYDSKCELVSEIIPPRFNRRARLPKLKEYMKESVAGSQNDRVTAFSASVREIEQYLKRKGGQAHIKDVLKDVQHHWSTNSSATQCIRTWCNKGIIKSFEFKKAHLIIKHNKITI